MLEPNQVIHQEVILFTSPPDFIRACISNPERILDYYPSPISGDVVEPNRAMVCRGRSGVSLLEVTSEHTDEKGFLHIELEVVSALLWKPPYSAERVREKGFFSMKEDWILEPFGAGTRLTKTWRDIQKYKWSVLPLASMVRKTAKGESKKMQTLWDDAYEQSLDTEEAKA